VTSRGSFGELPFGKVKTVPTVRYPSLYQINTRVWLTDLARGLGRPTTLDDIPDAGLDQLAALGFDWIWMLSVWQVGLAGQRVSRSNHEWRKEFEETLPDLREEDIPGPGSRSPVTWCTRPSAGMRPWPASESGSANAASG
jgi:hypothetical protein